MLNIWKSYTKRLIGKEISAFSRYYDRIVQWKVLSHDKGELLEQVECPEKKMLGANEDIADMSGEAGRSLVLLNGVFNYNFDIQGLLIDLKEKLSRGSRVVAVAYNPYFRWLYWLTNKLNIREGELPATFMTHTDLEDLAKISGYDVVRVRRTVYCPFRLLGIGSAINWLMPSIPLLRSLCLASVVVMRPIKGSEKPSLSILIPARDEKGNIENALKRMPDFQGAEIEIIFVEGHSSDGTWEEIQRVSEEYSDRYKIKCFQQTGIGKNDAVRLGFSHASCDLLTILDADLTMPPELLERYYDAYCSGIADFINGSRLLYPMEGEAMRFLNKLGNVFFAKTLSWVLDNNLGDSLCGTKLFSRDDYQRIVRWRNDFGDFDPFGDFELLFPASILGLGTVCIPIRYRSRTYGSTSISRFRHGLMLIKMTVIGYLKIKTGRLK